MTIAQEVNLIRLAFGFPKLTVKKLEQKYYGASRKRTEFPALLNFFLYSGCNLKCSMCGQWRTRSTGRSSPETHYLPLQTLKEIIDHAAAFSPEVYVWGGEPTLHPNFAEFMEYLKKKKLVSTVNTNGTRLKDLAEKIIESGLDSIDISIDGPPEIHDSIRGVPGTFLKIIQGLQELERKRVGKKPLVKAVITLSQDNLLHIEKLLEDLDSNSGVHMSIIQLGWFTNTLLGEKHEKQLKSDFGVDAYSWKGFEDNQSHERAKKAREIIQRIRVRRYKKPILFFPNLSEEMIERYYANPADGLGRTRCKALYREINIRPNGEVVICGDFPDVVVGNVYAQTVKEIWAGERINQFREYVEQRGGMPICNRCCGLFK
jgi:radical SAM protein with 4Fe4S-binding SPASM domain